MECKVERKEIVEVDEDIEISEWKVVYLSEIIPSVRPRGSLPTRYKTPGNSIRVDMIVAILYNGGFWLGKVVKMTQKTLVCIGLTTSTHLVCSFSSMSRELGRNRY